MRLSEDNTDQSARICRFRHARGYVALYRYVDEIDTVFVLAGRSRREAGYAER